MLEHNKKIRKLLIFSILSINTFCVNALAKCSVPRYQIGKILENSNTSFVADISIQPKELVPLRLVCLATALKEQHPKQAISAYIFDSHEAARNNVPLAVEYAPKLVAWASRLHAVYFYNADKHEDYMVLIPDGLSQENDSPFNTRIDLPITKPPSCRLEIQNRCLLEFQHFTYGFGDNEREVFGTITLSGIIGKQGKITNIHITTANVMPPEQRNLLSAKARANLSTWRFTPDNKSNEIELTYGFEIINSSELKHKTQVQFFLPHKVIIRTGRVR